MFLIDIYNDLSLFQVQLKPPQIGLTVCNINKSIWWCYFKRNNIIYTLPSASDVEDMAGSKIDKIINQNPVFKKMLNGKQTMTQKNFGQNTIHYRGTKSETQAMMISSDLNIHDEVDASDMEMIVQFETRLQGKANGGQWYFSHPSISGRGVDVYWEQSDKKEWFITCDSCKKEQFMTFPDNIDFEKRCYVCKHCKKELSDKERRVGKWKPTRPLDENNLKPKFSGYHVSQLMCVWIKADKILKDWEDTLIGGSGKKDKAYFYNKVLGLPYKGADNSITSQDILKNTIKDINTEEDPIVIGGDTGLHLHYVVGNLKGIFLYGVTDEPSRNYNPYDTLEALLKTYPKAIMVIDQGGDITPVRILKDKYIGRVFLCKYMNTIDDLVSWGTGGKYGWVYADRNKCITTVVEQFKEGGRIYLNGKNEDWEAYARHWGNIIRVVEDTPIGAKYVWERNGHDHWVHSTIYFLIGLTKYGNMEAHIISDKGTGHKIERASDNVIVELTELKTDTNGFLIEGDFIS